MRPPDLVRTTYPEANMTHVNLDSEPEAVRQFVLTLAVPPEGALLELGGRPVACILPPPQPTNGAEEEEWTDSKNRRRCDLIDRKYDIGLTPAEEAELAALQTAMHRHIDRVAPLPLEATRQMHQELLKKATKAQVESDS
jgi:hypothetical protein